MVTVPGRVSEFQGFRVTKFQGFRVSGFQLPEELTNKSFVVKSETRN